MRVLVAPCSFKGTLSATAAAEAIGAGLRAAGADVDLAPIADGGEGTLDALVAAVGGSVMGVIARGPMGIPVRAHIAHLDDGTGVVELAQASGLGLVPESERDPMIATTTGTGELIKGALARRPSRLVVALGGSATVDGGTGLARALGVRFVDADGAEVARGGAGLASIARIDNGGLDPRIVAVPILVAADVATTLTDAATMFGPQKGATPDMIIELTSGLRTLGERIEADLHVGVLDAPGGGAAGGAGAMLLGLGGDLKPGASVVMEAIGFDRRLAEADLVITGEGRLDEGTSHGKGPSAVLARAVDAAVPCVALVGEAAGPVEMFADVRSIADVVGDVDAAKVDPAGHLRGMAARLFSERRFG